ncbi:unnamed protein product [Trichogramma brassicae]|uniref:C-type lectin domain-containing protein n=1 Tax=Trichogramma brassicae TaxID=86971 RepID=A0A6H5ICL8_9HYME|nr:unnamed protein product [Trichogramma brassicae]
MEVIEPATGMVKSRSYNALAMQARRRHHQGRLSDQQARNSMFEPLLGNMETNFGGMTREPISVPNFRALALPTPVLTPIEAARLVFVDPDEDTDDDDNEDAKKNASSNRLIEVPEEDRSDFASLHQSHQPPRGESYSSNLCDAAQTPKTPCTRLPHSTSVRFADLEEGEESTSDYASIGARSPGDPLAEDDWPKRNSKSFRNSQNFKDNQLSFSNPNYLGLENTSELSDQDVRYAKMLNSPPDSVLEDEPGRSTSQTFSDLLEMQELGTSTRPRAPPKSLPLGSPSRRAVSASRAERQRAKLAASERNEHNSPSPAPLYVFLIVCRLRVFYQKVNKLLDMMRKSESLVRGSTNGEEALLGIHDLYKEADWVTIFGEPLASTGYAGWSSTYWNGQPDNRDKRQHCGALINQGGMDDVDCHDKFAFFCELPLAC